VFKIPQEKASRLIQDRREHVLKREVDDVNAERYREVLEEIGLEVRIEPAGAPLGGEAAAGRAPSVDQRRAQDEAETGSAAKAGAAAGADPSSPYASPRADGAPSRPDAEGAMTGPQALPAGHGWLWLKDAYALFRARPGTWLGAIVVIYFLNIVLSLVPLVGGLVGFLLGPVFAGGLMSGARELDRHGVARTGMVFDGFSGPALQLALVGLLYLAGFLVVVLAAGIITVAIGAVSPASLEAMSSNDPEAIATAMAPMALLLMMLIVMALVVPLLMAYWFAPALVMLEGMGAVQAMQASFRGCWMNILPFLVYGLAMLGIGLGFALAVGLVAGLAAPMLGPAATYLSLVGVLLVIPVIVAFAAVAAISQYTGYRDIFHHAG
jgi:uncharacterized membrane protein